jgi:hypothetical protein
VRERFPGVTLVELPEELTRLQAGSMVDFLPFSELCQ